MRGGSRLDWLRPCSATIFVERAFTLQVEGRSTLRPISAKSIRLSLVLKLARNRCAPTRRDTLDPLQRLLQQIARADEREPQIVFSGRTKRRSGDSRDASLFQ